MTIEDIEKEVLAWQKSTFPRATKDAFIDKLGEECDELTDAISFHLNISDRIDQVVQEVADVAIVSIALLAKMNTSLSAVIAAKLAVNKARTWGEETPSGDRPRQK